MALYVIGLLLEAWYLFGGERGVGRGGGGSGLSVLGLGFCLGLGFLGLGFGFSVWGSGFRRRP